ncbi:BUD13 homolog [Lingula anatina]|uniref:BUD13 homolog n=1 Tax=Lingula anatina TaxID=7574 RepID=A0A1S3IS51_LINAN|nr:BUD13 homolog [Lingula anatina]|eukprot:XP_013400359.2 BUD13 homolog [Lingula anatina]
MSVSLLQIDAEALGKNAETVFRDKGGKRRNLKEEKLKQRAEDAKKEEMNEKYMVWGKGMAQKAQQEQTLQETLHEMDKPLARFKDDEVLDAMLKERERAEDPMLAYMQKKKAKENKGGSKAKAKPRYRGPEPPPNRFNIWPGYRWDGVDRSNGFEKEFFAKMANKKAVADMAYKWSVEDM